MRVGGRVVVVGTMRFRERWMEAVVDAMLGELEMGGCGFGGLGVEVKCWGDAFEVKVVRELEAKPRDSYFRKDLGVAKT
jgi:hypothetical protein